MSSIDTREGVPCAPEFPETTVVSAEMKYRQLERCTYPFVLSDLTCLHPLSISEVSMYSTGGVQENV